MKITATGLGKLEAEKAKSGPNVVITVVDSQGELASVCEIGPEEFARFLCAAAGLLI